MHKFNSHILKKKQEEKINKDVSDSRKSYHNQIIDRTNDMIKVKNNNSIKYNEEIDNNLKFDSNKDTKGRCSVGFNTANPRSNFKELLERFNKPFNEQPVNNEIIGNLNQEDKNEKEKNNNVIENGLERKSAVVRKTKNKPQPKANPKDKRASQNTASIINNDLAEYNNTRNSLEVNNQPRMSRVQELIKMNEKRVLKSKLESETNYMENVDEIEKYLMLLKLNTSEKNKNEKKDDNQNDSNNDWINDDKDNDIINTNKEINVNQERNPVLLEERKALFLKLGLEENNCDQIEEAIEHYEYLSQKFHSKIQIEQNKRCTVRDTNNNKSNHQSENNLPNIPDDILKHIIHSIEIGEDNELMNNLDISLESLKSYKEESIRRQIENSRKNSKQSSIKIDVKDKDKEEQLIIKSKFNTGDLSNRKDSNKNSDREIFKSVYNENIIDKSKLNNQDNVKIDSDVKNNIFINSLNNNVNIKKLYYKNLKIVNRQEEISYDNVQNILLNLKFESEDFFNLAPLYNKHEKFLYIFSKNKKNISNDINIEFITNNNRFIQEQLYVSSYNDTSNFTISNTYNKRNFIYSHENILNMHFLKNKFQSTYDKLCIYKNFYNEDIAFTLSNIYDKIDINSNLITQSELQFSFEKNRKNKAKYSLNKLMIVLEKSFRLQGIVKNNDEKYIIEASNFNYESTNQRSFENLILQNSSNFEKIKADNKFEEEITSFALNKKVDLITKHEYHNIDNTFTFNQNQLNEQSQSNKNGLERTVSYVSSLNREKDKGSIVKKDSNQCIEMTNIFESPKESLIDGRKKNNIVLARVKNQVSSYSVSNKNTQSETITSQITSNLPKLNFNAAKNSESQCINENLGFNINAIEKNEIRERIEYQKNIIDEIDSFQLQQRRENYLDPLLLDMLCINCYCCIKYADIDKHTDKCLVVEDNQFKDKNNEVEEEQEDYNSKIFKLYESLKAKAHDYEYVGESRLTECYSRLKSSMYEVFLNNYSLEELNKQIQVLADIRRSLNNVLSNYKYDLLIYTQRIAQLVLVKFEDIEKILTLVNLDKKIDDSDFEDSCQDVEDNGDYDEICSNQKDVDKYNTYKTNNEKEKEKEEHLNTDTFQEEMRDSCNYICTEEGNNLNPNIEYICNVNEFGEPESKERKSKPPCKKPDLTKFKTYSKAVKNSEFKKTYTEQDEDFKKLKEELKHLDKQTLENKKVIFVFI